MDAVIPRSPSSVMFCTPGIVLRLLQSDPDLLRFTHIIVDEAHERELNTDILLVLLRDIVARRPDIHIVLMSATLNAAQFGRRARRQRVGPIRPADAL